MSASGFTQPALKVYEDALAAKVAFLCELEEIVLLLERRAELRDFLKQKVVAATIDKNPLHKPFTYV